MNTAQSKSRTPRQKSSDYSRPIMIHVCKDGTVTYRRPGEAVFNGVALPVFSVNTPEQAEAIQVRFCRRQYGEHPQMPGEIWYRLSHLGDGSDPASRPSGMLDFEDLEGVTVMFREFFDAHLATDADLRASLVLDVLGLTAEDIGGARADQLRVLARRQRATIQQLERLILAAKRWARFQEPDSLEDQKTDTVLQAEAIEAREALLTIVEELP